MDVLGDTEDAIAAYECELKKNETTSKAMSYLMVYGLLQAIDLQYEAVDKIINSLKIKSIHNYNQYSKFIQIRHDLAAHPFSKPEGKIKHSYFIIQNNLSLKNISYYKITSNKADSCAGEHHLNVKKYLDERRIHMKNVLSQLIGKII